MFKIKIEGLNALKTALKKYSRSVEDRADKLISNFADNVLDTAKSNAKFNFIRAELGKNTTELGYSITTDSNISAYLEFGTGNFAKALLSSYPSEWVQLAQTFYISGFGRTPAFPYLYPAYIAEKHKFITNLRVNFEKL